MDLTFTHYLFFADIFVYSFFYLLFLISVNQIILIYSYFSLIFFCDNLCIPSFFH